MIQWSLWGATSRCLQNRFGNIWEYAICFYYPLLGRMKTFFFSQNKAGIVLKVVSRFNLWIYFMVFNWCKILRVDFFRKFLANLCCFRIWQDMHILTYQLIFHQCKALLTLQYHRPDSSRHGQIMLQVSSDFLWSSYY